MAEVNTAEANAKADEAFGAGFGVTPPAETPPAKVGDEAAPEAVKPEPAVAPEKPQYVRLTKQEWDNTKAAAGKVPSLESQVAKLMGGMPKAEQIVQQVLEKVSSQTPAGLNVEISDEDFAELAADFPELAGHTRAALERILKRANVKGTGPTQQPKPESPAAPVDIKAAIAEALRERETERESEALAEAYPDWDDIVGRPKDGVSRAEGNPFRAWLATQPAEYQKKVNETMSPAVVKAAIDTFKASQSVSVAPSPKPDKAAARRAVIEDAVTPRADGSPPPLNTPVSAEEAFSSGFKAVKAH